MSPSPQDQQVTDLYCQKQHCKLKKSNISLIALFSHSVSLDWITFVDAAVCTGEFCHLPKAPCYSCQCLSLAPFSPSLPATNRRFWPMCAPSTCSSILNWFYVVGFLCVCLVFFIFLKDTPCNTKSPVGLGSILTAVLRLANFKAELHRCHSLVMHLFWILLQSVPLKMLPFVKGWRYFFLHWFICPLLLYFLWMNALVPTGRVGCLKLCTLCWEVLGGDGRSVP